MRYRQRYACFDLGEQQEGNKVVAKLTGSAANVVLVDEQNFARYRAGQEFSYVGGLQRSSPAELEIPGDGHWYVVVDLGGAGGRSRAAVKVLRPDGSRVELATDQAMVSADAS